MRGMQTLRLQPSEGSIAFDLLEIEGDYMRGLPIVRQEPTLELQ